jgi:hypothetical protein
MTKDKPGNGSTCDARSRRTFPTSLIIELLFCFYKPWARAIVETTKKTDGIQSV